MTCCSFWIEGSRISRKRPDDQRGESDTLRKVHCYLLFDVPVIRRFALSAEREPKSKQTTAPRLGHGACPRRRKRYGQFIFPQNLRGYWGAIGRAILGVG